MKRKRYPRAMRERQEANRFLRDAPAVAEAFKKYAAGMRELCRAFEALKDDWPICIKKMRLAQGYGMGARRMAASLKAERMRR